MLCETSSSSTLDRPYNVHGSTPVSSLKLTSNNVTFERCPRVGGIQPENLFPSNTNSLSVATIFPTVSGMQPSNWLFARTITEAVEFPMLRGMGPSKRLSFTIIASSGLSKSLGGSFPSKSLYLISR
jgi:hypothetical protein